jgi:3-oxoacyl-[acyl-carrier-protein] synthase III
MSPPAPTPHDRSRSAPKTPLRPPETPRIGVRIAGTGSCLPANRLTNDELMLLMDTSDEWIRQRTGISERRVVDLSKNESALTLCAAALRKALANASLAPTDLDLLIVATVSGGMTCPSTACRVAAEVGAGSAGAWDVLAACSGWVFSLNSAHDMIRAGSYRTIGVVGCDVLSPIVDYTAAGRGVSILFGDAAGAAILRSTDDTGKGIVSQVMHADGTRWKDLFIPGAQRDIPEEADRTIVKPRCLQMNGREVYKFAVTTFTRLIEETLEKAGIDAERVDHFICHQSNARILESARERFGIPHEKMYVNIDRVGNTSAGSVPLCLDELRTAGRVKEGQVVMFVAFGGGLTWASSLWQL